MSHTHASTTSRAHEIIVPASRILDLIMGCAGLVVLWPVMLLTALAIWMESGRPIVFSQLRLGQGGRQFRMHKFRKFHKEIGTNSYLIVRNDRRLTRIGSFLLKTKLDELPQLFNILKGEMSVVGPRPESLHFADCFAPDYLSVLDHKPGIFGPNQFYFRDEGSIYSDAPDPDQFYREILFPLKANIDLAYFQNRTMTADIGWIIRGVLVVFGLRLWPGHFNIGKMAGGGATTPR